MKQALDLFQPGVGVGSCVLDDLKGQGFISNVQFAHIHLNFHRRKNITGNVTYNCLHAILAYQSAAG